MAVGVERVFPRTWMRTHGPIHHAIRVQKTTMFVLLSFLVAVAAFNLVSTLVMVVDQRRGDIAILKTLGSKGPPQTGLWKKAAGPGDVTLADARAETTTATFAAVGDYVLELAATKGPLAASSRRRRQAGRLQR